MSGEQPATAHSARKLRSGGPGSGDRGPGRGGGHAIDSADTEPGPRSPIPGTPYPDKSPTMSPPMAWPTGEGMGGACGRNCECRWLEIAGNAAPDRFRHAISHSHLAPRQPARPCARAARRSAVLGLAPRVGRASAARRSRAPVRRQHLLSRPEHVSYSDAMLLLGLLGAPFIWMGVHPIIVHNLLVIAAFVTAGLAMTRLMAYFTADRTAQFIAALIFSCAIPGRAHRASRAALDRLPAAHAACAIPNAGAPVGTPRRRAGCRGRAAGALQHLLRRISRIWLAAAVVLSPLRFGWPTSRRHLAAFGVAALSAAIVLSPYLVRYRARTSLGPRTAKDLQLFSAQLSDYARATPNHRLYPSERRGDDDERSLFPGGLATTLAVVSVFILRTRTTTLLALLTVIAIDLSLGVNGLLFNLLRVPLPWLDSFRAPARFAVLTLLGISVLAGLAVERLSAPARTSTRRVLAAILAAVLVGGYWAPLDAVYRPPLEAGPAERWLAAQPSLVVAALPLPKAGKLWGYETVFQYLSIFHWQPMVNGYSGNMPRHYLSLVWDLEHFLPRSPWPHYARAACRSSCFRSASPRPGSSIGSSTPVRTRRGSARCSCSRRLATGVRLSAAWPGP